ncbi:MAG: Rv2175c family DNA-binding protein [Pseudonocardia sp.]|nr:Rv2175c family DNA-binding protein [Pseudonocardia sp.]
MSDVAATMDIPVTRVHQLVRDGQLLSFKKDGTAVIPAAFLVEAEIVKGLSGTITVLRDGGYSDPDILRWLFEVDDTLPGAPIDALVEGRHREIKRRAQAMAF